MGVQTSLTTKAEERTSTSHKVGTIPLNSKHTPLAQRHRREARDGSNTRKKRVVSKIQAPELKNNSTDMMFISRWPKALSDEKALGQGVRRRPQGLDAASR